MSKNKEVSKKSQVNIKTQFELPQMTLMSLLQFGSQTLLVEAIKAEISEALGRGFYQHSESKENLKGYRHGVRKTTLDTPLGPIVYDRPRVNGIDFKSQFHVPYMRRPTEFAAQICDMYVNGTSTRKVKKALKSVTGDKLKLSKSTVSRITKTLVLEFKSWKRRTFYLFPRNHWLKIRTSNKLERLNLEIRRRLNVIGRHPSEEGCFALIYQVAKNYSHPQQRVQVNDMIKKLWIKIREERLAMIQQLQFDLFVA